MKKRIIAWIALGVGVGCLFIWLLARSPGPEVNGQFTAQEVRQIEQTVRDYRWTILGSLLRTHRFKWAFQLCTADALFGSIRKIEACSGPFAINGVVTNTAGANVVCQGWVKSKVVRYELARMGAGWQVSVVAFPRGKTQVAQALGKWE